MMRKTRTSTQTPSKPAKSRVASRAAAARTPKLVSAKVEPAKPASNRAERAAERREAIIAAAMDEFIAQGFAATRLDDVAKRAGVAKGTIYLHFKDKEALFEELIRTAIVPLVNRLAAGPPPSGASVRDMEYRLDVNTSGGRAFQGGVSVALVGADGTSLLGLGKTGTDGALSFTVPFVTPLNGAHLTATGYNFETREVVIH